MATINQFFTDGADSFTAATAANTYFLTFLDGIDRLTVQAGTVTASMGEGNDLVTVQGGVANVYGEAGNDRFDLYASGTVHGGSGDDLFYLRAGSGPTAFGDLGADRFDFLAAMTGVSLSGGDDNDLFNGNGYAIGGTVNGDRGNDVFTGFSGAAVTLRGGLGNDTYRVDPTSPATLVENLGEGIDTVQVAVGMSYRLVANVDNIVVQPFAIFAGPATLRGNVLDNHITGSAVAETLYGNGGNDVLVGNGGIDQLFGGIGNDTLDGGIGNDAMAGGAGDDLYTIDSAGDTVAENAGEGIDTVRSTLFQTTLGANVENGVILSESNAILTGNALANVLTSGAGLDKLEGLAGSDDLRGGGDVDWLVGGNGNDKLDGGAGGDLMEGGAGNDTYVLDDLSDDIREAPGQGTDTILFNTRIPPIDGMFVMPDNVENAVLTVLVEVHGNGLANRMTGSDDTDDLFGAGGDDTLLGKGGFDVLVGQDGRDTINGGDDGDNLYGDGAGTTDFQGDTLTGGAGSDLFIYIDVAESAPFVGRSDQITDFETGIDHIALVVDANANVIGTQEWNLVDAPTGAAGQLWIDSSGSGTGDYVVLGDDDGDGLADLLIRIHAPSGFVGTDVIL